MVILGSATSLAAGLFAFQETAMLPHGYKVGSTTPPPPRGPSTAAKVGSAARAVGGKVAGGAKAAGSAWVAGAKVIGQGAASAAKGAANTVAIHAKHPVAGLVKAPLVNVKNEYKKTFNDPSRNGAKDTMKANAQRAPIKSTIKVAAGATGALAPLAAAKGLAQPGKSLQTNRNMKADAAEKKMGGLSWTPPAKAPGAAGAKTGMGRPRS